MVNMDKFCSLKLFLLITYAASGQAFYDSTITSALFTNLTSGYNILVRPDEPQLISVEFSALAVNFLDIKSQTFSITGYISMSWTDSRLAWNTANFNYAEYMFFTDAYIWKPEMVIVNSAESISIIDNDDLYMRVDYKGTVTWEPPGVYVVNCDVDVTYYPYDTQTCYIGLSTWSHDQTLIYMAASKGSINLDDYQENGEWTLTDSYIRSTSKIDQNAQFTRAKLEFYFEMQRKSGYYILNVLMPSMLTSFLGLMVFLLPADSGEKVGFSITVLLALAVLLTIVTDYIPTTSKNTSLFAVYLLCNLFVCSFEVVVTVFVLRLHHNMDKEKPVPARVQKFAQLILARLSCSKVCFRTRVSGEDLSEVFTGRTLTKSAKHGKELTVTDIAHCDKKQFLADGTAKMTSEMQNDHDGANKEYTWSEIAVMVDISAFYLCTVMLIAFAIGFSIALVCN